MRALLLLLLITISTFAQDLDWTEISGDFDLPESVSIYSGESEDPPIRAWYLDYDLADTNYIVMPFLSQADAGAEGIVPFVESVGAVELPKPGAWGTSDRLTTTDLMAMVNEQGQATSFLAYPR